MLGTYTNLTATVRDNDSIFNFTANAVSAVENAGTVTLTVVRTGGVVGAATVRYTGSTNSSALSGPLSHSPISGIPFRPFLPLA